MKKSIYLLIVEILLFYRYEALYKDFLDALGENSEPLVNGFAGLKIILAVYKSQKTGLQVKFKNFIDFLF